MHCINGEIELIQKVFNLFITLAIRIGLFLTLVHLNRKRFSVCHIGIAVNDLRVFIVICNVRAESVVDDLFVLVICIRETDTILNEVFGFTVSEWNY